MSFVRVHSSIFQSNTYQLKSATMHGNHLTSKESTDSIITPLELHAELNVRKTSNPLHPLTNVLS